jgi:hypothetical protein
MDTETTRTISWDDKEEQDDCKIGFCWGPESSVLDYM